MSGKLARCFILTPNRESGRDEVVELMLAIRSILVSFYVRNIPVGMVTQSLESLEGMSLIMSLVLFYNDCQ